MSIEEKAKAYDEAIKKAKEIKEKIVYSHLSTESCKAVSEYIDTIIPELREKPLTPFQQCLNCILRGVYYAEVPDKKVNEFIVNVVRTRTDELIKLAKRHEDTDCQLHKSKDERIRKALIDALKVSETIGELKFRLPYPTREECIAYLEKQKESLHIQETCKENTDSFTSEDEKIRKEIIDFLETIPASELKRIPRPISEWFFWLKKQKEPHIPWYDYQKSKEAGYTIVPNEEYEQLIKQKEQKSVQSNVEKEYIRTIKSLISDFIRGKREIDTGYYQKIYDWLDGRHVEPKPTWSEEDELMRTVIIQTLERFGGRGTTGIQIDWLKSLRPSWKPSEEQMNALHTYIYNPQYSDTTPLPGSDMRVIDIVKQFYEQLLKNL
jgi:hypothetical protein